MRRQAGFAFALLVFCSLDFAQTSKQNGAHDQEWTERHQQYLNEPIIQETASAVEITANDPRPLDNVLGALVRQHGWHVNYEDPRYSQVDLVDDTAPSWLQDHPNGPRVHVMAGGAFFASIPTDGRFPDDPIEILPALADAYDRSGNPGQFQLRVIGDDSFDIIPIASGDGPQTPLLDAMMNFDAANIGATETLTKFCEQLSRQAGYTVEFAGPGPISDDGVDPSVTQHSLNQSAREILRQIFEQIRSTDCWRVLYDPDSNKFFLLIRSAW